jgi:transposase
MEKITLCGIDLAKNVYQVECRNHAGKTLVNKKVRREHLMEFINQLPKSCVVAMEACAGAHELGRECKKIGLQVKLMPAQFVTAFRRAQKNDPNDTGAICNAAVAPKMRFVEVKSEEQQCVLSLHRSRELLIKNRTAMSNHLRGLLTERGIVMGVGLSTLRKSLPRILEKHREKLGELSYEHFCQLYESIKRIDNDIAGYDRQLRLIAKGNPDARLLCDLPTVGVCTATAIVATVGKATQFKNGRNFAASLGLVPRQNSSGGRIVLGSITKRGDAYVRKLLIHGARSVIRHAEHKTDNLSLWLKELKRSKGANVAAVALANKMARVIWVVLARGVEYSPALVSRAV